MWGGDHSAELNFGRGRSACFLNLFRQWVFAGREGGIILLFVEYAVSHSAVTSSSMQRRVKVTKKERKGSLYSYLFDLSFSDNKVFVRKL